MKGKAILFLILVFSSLGIFMYCSVQDDVEVITQRLSEPRPDYQAYTRRKLK